MSTATIKATFDVNGKRKPFHLSIVIFSSSLHGLRYITEDGRHWTERVLWVFLCTIGFVLTVYFIYPIWARWNEKASNIRSLTLTH